MMYGKRQVDRRTGGWGERGASAVEFAILLPLLMVLLLGTIDFFFLLYDKAMITNASREGARAGVAYRFDYSTSPGSYAPLDQSEVEAVVDAYLQDSSLLYNFSPSSTQAAMALRCFNSADFSAGSVINCDTRTTAGRDETGYWIEVEVAYDYNFLAIPNLLQALPGVLGTALPQVKQINSITRMRME